MIYRRIQSFLILIFCFFAMVQTVSAAGNNTLDGDYIAVGYFSDPWSYLSLLTFDGAGTISYADIATSDNNNETGSETYSVETNGRVTLAGESGVVSSDGDFVTWVNTEGSYVGISMAVKKSSGKSNASLNGQYIGIGYYRGPWSNLISITFDGSGSAAYSDIQTSDNNNESGTVSYTVDSDGTLTLDGLSGIISPDANVIVWVDTDGTDIGMYIAIKKSSGMSNASLDGGYFGSGYYSNPWTNFISLSFNGSGSVSYDDIMTSDDDNQSGTTTYSLDSDGDFTLNTINGIFSSDANVGAWVDTSSNIGFYVAIKKSATSSDGGGDGGCFIQTIFSSMGLNP